MQQDVQGKVDSRAMREVNRSIVLDIIRRGGKVSRTDLAKRSALTKPTVSAIVDDLIARGIVQEVGFGKTVAHNLTLLRSLARFAEIAPVVAGLSRKATIGTLTGRDDPADRAVGSAAAAMIAVQNGALIVRVHDVAATRDALLVWRGVAEGAPPPKAASKPKRAFDDDD